MLLVLDSARTPEQVRPLLPGSASWSVRQLPAATAEAFALLSVHPGEDIGVAAVAALTGSTAERAQRVLDELERAHLVRQSRANRYGMHDLLRAYAAERLAGAGTAPALDALHSYYLDATVTANLAWLEQELPSTPTGEHCGSPAMRGASPA